MNVTNKFEFHDTEEDDNVWIFAMKQLTNCHNHFQSTSAALQEFYCNLSTENGGAQQLIL